VASAYSRVTVLADSRRVDVALPGTSRVSELLPQLLTLCSADTGRSDPTRWVLARFGGGEIPHTQSLADAGVTDGELLELHARGTENRPAFVEDVRDVLEDTIDGTGSLWTPHITFRFALYTVAIAFGLLMLLDEARGIGRPVPMVASAVLAAVLVGTALWAIHRKEHAPARLLIAVACAWGALFGWLAAGSIGWSVWGTYAGAAMLAMSVAATTFAATRLAAPHLAALAVVALTATVVATTITLGAQDMPVVQIAGVLSVLLIGVLPRVSLAAGGVANADYRVRNTGSITADELSRRIRLSAELLTGSVLGVSAVTAWSAGMLAMSTGLWDRILAATLGIAILLRSRVFSQVHHVIPVRVAGLAVLVANGLHLYRDNPDARVLMLLAPVLVTVALLVLSSLTLSDIVQARIKQLLNIAEIVVFVVLFPALAMALGLFTAIGGVTS
jgi:type VII secretion integral membrane protein EccD